MIKNRFTPTPLSSSKKSSLNIGRIQIADGLYEATYSNIEVYEFITHDEIAVMRRKSDSWINATHILKVAGVEKGKRTKILEKEIQDEDHEKIQGGYGRYQGTWIPIERARELARQFEVDGILAPILDLP